MKIIITESQAKLLLEDLIKGGKADNKSVEDIAKLHNVSVEHINKQLKIGIPTEHEHTKNNKIAKEIALDHLEENPNYYTTLDKAGLVDEKFESKAQARYFYYKAGEKGKEGKKFKKLAKEFSDKTNFKKLPERK